MMQQNGVETKFASWHPLGPPPTVVCARAVVRPEHAHALRTEAAHPPARPVQPALNMSAHSLKPGSPVSVLIAPDSELVLGSGVVHAVAANGTVQVYLDWKLADGRPASLFAQPESLRLVSPVTKIGAAVAVISSTSSGGTRSVNDGVFARGVVAGVRNPDMVVVHLQWKLADGSPATLYTPAANLMELAAAEEVIKALKARETRIASGLHAAQFKSRTKVIVLSSDGAGRTFSPGTVTKLNYTERQCIVDLPWKLADGSAPKLYVQAELLRLPNRDETLRHAAELKDEGGKLFAKKEYFAALQVRWAGRVGGGGACFVLCTRTCAITARARVETTRSRSSM
jgi:hypothetical protein